MNIDDGSIVSSSIEMDRGYTTGVVKYAIPTNTTGYNGSNINAGYIATSRRFALKGVEKEMNIRTVAKTVGRDTAYVELHADLPYINRTKFVGEAKRAPQDKADEEIALLLAYTRALELAASKLRRRVNGLMKQQNDLAEAKAAKKAPAKKVRK